jgi:hypothetical protein
MADVPSVQQRHAQLALGRQDVSDGRGLNVRRPDYFILPITLMLPKNLSQTAGKAILLHAPAFWSRFRAALLRREIQKHDDKTASSDEDCASTRLSEVSDVSFEVDPGADARDGGGRRTAVQERAW